MLDARGLSCPLPVLMVQQELKKTAPAELTALVDARVAVENITRCAHTLGYDIAVEPRGGEFVLTLRKR